MLHLKRRIASAVALAAVFCLTAGLTLPGANTHEDELLFVVERERGSLARIVDREIVGHISGLGDTSHATVKFHNGDGYCISRDGILTRFSPTTGDIIAQRNVGKSSIGFTFAGDYIAIANYNPHTVVFLDHDLKEVHRMATGSRNVGLKSDGRFLFFSLMDKDEIRVVDVARKFTLHKKFTNVGGMPFDALLADNTYIAGMFKGGALGVVDTESMTLTRVSLATGPSRIPLKVPHFGTWGVVGDTAYIPAVGEPRLYRYNLKTHTLQGHIAVAGSPVFAAVSPDGQYLAVNYSGKAENLVSLVNVAENAVVRTVASGNRVMHLRFAHDGQVLFVSSYFDNRVTLHGVPKLKEKRTLTVPTPSGIFLAPPAGD